MANPAYGILVADRPAPTVGDLRVHPNRSSSAHYTTIADPDFIDGVCHQFTAAGGTVLFYYLADCGMIAGQDITPAVGDVIRGFAEMKIARPVGVADEPYVLSLNGVLRFQLKTFINVLMCRIVLTADGVQVFGAYFQLNAVMGTAEYHHLEWELERTATDLYTAKAYVDGVLVSQITNTTTVVHTVTVSAVIPCMTGIPEKGAVIDVRFGRVVASWFNTTMTHRCQQFYTAWLPNLIYDHPSGDVDTNDFTPVGDAVNEFQNVNDDPYVAATHNWTPTDAVERDLLMSWPNVGALGDDPVVVINVQVGVAFGSAAAPHSKTHVMSKNGTATAITGLSEHDCDTSFTGDVQTGVFMTDPDGAALTEARIDATDYGVRKPATAGTDAAASQLWRVVLHGGNAIPDQTEPPPRQSKGTRGKIAQRPIYDHIDPARPRSMMGGLLRIRETIEKTTRNRRAVMRGGMVEPCCGRSNSRRSFCDRHGRRYGARVMADRHAAEQRTGSEHGRRAPMGYEHQTDRRADGGQLRAPWPEPYAHRRKRSVPNSAASFRDAATAVGVARVGVQRSSGRATGPRGCAGTSYEDRSIAGSDRWCERRR